MKKLLIFLLFFLFLTPASLAAGEIGSFRPPQGLPSGETNIAEILTQTADILLRFVGSVAVLILIMGGIQYALAVGEEERQSQAKRTMKWAIFGLVLAVLSYAIVELVAKVLG